MSAFHLLGRFAVGGRMLRALPQSAGNAYRACSSRLFHEPRGRISWSILGCSSETSSRVFVSKASVPPGLEVPELGSTAAVSACLRPMSQEAETWLALTPQQQFARLAACPAAKMVPFLESLEASGLRPEMRLWNQALRDVAQSRRVNLELLENIVEKLWRKGYHPDAGTYESLLYMCRKGHQFSRALEIYKGMTARSVPPNEQTFSLLARALSSTFVDTDKVLMVDDPLSIQVDNVVTILEEMQLWNVNMTTLVADLLTRVLRTPCNSVKLHARAIAIVEELQTRVRHQGLKADDGLCSRTIDCYAFAGGNMSKALAACEDMRRRGEGVGPQTYAALIRGCLVRKDFEQVQHLMKRADQEGIVFEGSSLALLIRACNEQGCYAEAELQFKGAETDGRINQQTILAYLPTCIHQGKLEEVLNVIAKHINEFNWRWGRGRYRERLVHTLLLLLAQHPTMEGEDIICQALRLCPSKLGGACVDLLQDGNTSSWEAFFAVLHEYQIWESSGAHELIEGMIDCFWAKGRRGDAVKLLIWARNNMMFKNVFCINEDWWSSTLLDLHRVARNSAKTFVLLALRDQVEKCLRHPSTRIRGLRLVIGKRLNHTGPAGTNLAEIQKFLQELPFEIEAIVQDKGGSLLVSVKSVHNVVKACLRRMP